MNHRERAELQTRINSYADPVIYRRDLLMPSGRGALRFGDAMADFQRRDFAAIDRAFIALAHGVQPSPARLWLERTKGASKDTDLAAALLWLFAFAPRMITAQVGAADGDQADELRLAARGIFNANPWLAERGIEIRSSSVINSVTGSTCEILTADAAGSHGARPDLVILNELTHIGRKEFAETLMDNAEKMPFGVVVIATNAGHLDTWQWKWRELNREDGAWYFSVFSERAPWLKPMSESEYRGPPIRFRRLWKGVWSGQNDEPAIAEKDLAAAIVNSLPAGHEPGLAYYGGVDLGFSRDAAAFVVVGKHVGYSESVPIENVRVPSILERMLIEQGEHEPPEEFETKWYPATGRLRVSAVSIWKPTPGNPVPLAEVEKAIRDFHSVRPLSHLYGDPWAYQQMHQSLVKDGIPSEMIEFRSPGNLHEMAVAVLDSFRDRIISIPQDIDGADDLIADIKSLQIAESEKHFRLKTPRRTVDVGTRHGDSATGLALATMAAQRFGLYTPNVINRPLVCYP